MVPAIAAASAASSAAGSVANFFGSYDKQKDANRQATNARAYQAALNGGNAAAYRFLVARGGGPPQTIGPLAGITDGGYIGGWASAPAKTDAANKAKSLAGKYETGILADPDGRTTVGGMDPTTGQPTSQTPVGASAGMLWLVLGGLALAAYLFSHRGNG
jgi:hypothetical protein